MFSDESIKKIKDIKFINDLGLYSRVIDDDKPVFKFYHLLGLHVPSR